VEIEYELEGAPEGSASTGHSGAVLMPRRFQDYCPDFKAWRIAVIKLLEVETET
jgi:hypothetical protein